MESDTDSEFSERDDSLTLLDVLGLGFRNENNPKKKKKTKKKTKKMLQSASKRCEFSPLEELGRRSFLGLMCPCRNPDTGAAERGFDPEELLRFVTATAVSPSSWLGSVKEATRVVRLSAQVYGYRSYLSLCRTSPVDRGFRPKELLAFVRGTAVSFGASNGEDADVCEEVEQLCSYRRFVSVRVDWVYRPDVEVEDSWMSEECQGSQEEIPDSPSSCEEAYGVISELEDDISTETQEQLSHEQMQDGRIRCVTNREDFRVISELEDDITTETQEQLSHEQMQDGRIRCVSNREDFSILDVDEEYESMVTTFEAGEYCVGTARENNSTEENLEMKNLHTDTLSQDSEVDIDVECSSSFSHVRPVDQIGENGTEFLVNKKNSDLSPCHASSNLLRNVPDLSGCELSVQSETDAACGKISETVSESNSLEQEDRITYLDHVTPISSDNTLVEFTPYLGENLDHVIPISSENTLVEFTPCLGENFVRSLISKYLAHSCDNSDISASMSFFKHLDTEFESGAKVSIMNSDDSDRSADIDIIPSSASPKEASQGCVVEKHMLGQFICPVTDENVDSSKVLLPSDDNCFPEPSPILGAQVLTGHTSDPNSLNGMLNFDAQCRTEDAHFSSDDASQGGIVNAASSSSSPTKTPYGINAKKRCDHYIAKNNSNCIFIPYSETIACESLMKRHLSSTHDETRTNDEGSVSSNKNQREFSPANVVTDFLDTSDAGAIMNDNLRSTLPESASKMTSHGKKRSSSLALWKHASKSSSQKKEGSTSQKKEGCGLHTASNVPSWHRFYASPLIRTGSESPSLYHESNAESTINEESIVMDKPSSSTLPVHASKSTFHKNRGSYSSSSLDKHAGRSASYNGSRVYASPSKSHGPKLPKISRKLQVPDRFSNLPKSLHMKFPRNFTLPSKQELVKKFGVFGLLDHLRTKVSTFTGAGQVVFLHQTDAYAAYEYVKRKNVFGHANVRFWLDEHENRRKGVHDLSASRASCLNLKSCLKTPEGEKKEKRKVRFLIADQLTSGSA